MGQKKSPEPSADDAIQNSRLGRLGLLLRRHEQVTLFGILVVCSILLCGYFLQLHWAHGKLIDIDEMDYESAAYSIDLNQADWPELANIPNIGEKLSKAIIDFRRAHGRFESIDQLNNVPGIGPAKLRLLREYALPLN